MSKLLIGYDVERAAEPEITRVFLRKLRETHREHPCTLFLLGQVIENNARELEELADDPIFDFQQHTYSHQLLKTVCMDGGDGNTAVYRGASLAQVEEEVAKTTELLRSCFGKECLGLTGPWGYYRGLADRPDILAMLHRLGIRFTRTYARDHHDFQPVPFEVQPFWYEPQGFPDVLEIPIHGWQDVYWREINGWQNITGYSTYLLECLGYVAERDIVWSHATHDWSSIRSDPEMSVIRDLLNAADRRGVEVEAYDNFYYTSKERLHG